MDSIKHIPKNLIEGFESLHSIELTDEERAVLTGYLDLTRDVIEANQLFEVFYFNFQNLINSFELKLNDTVVRKEHCPPYDSEIIAVNALIINLISSAKTLTEFLRTTNKSDEFNQEVSKIYDSNYGYRVLINLRNFMQHGHLPVSFQENRYCFDFKQILKAPHFNFNAQLVEDMRSFLDILETPEKPLANLALTITLANFVVQVIDIHRKYLFYIQKDISLSYEKFQKIISDNPKLVCDYNATFNGYVLFDMDDNSIHALNSKDNPNISILNYYERLEKIYEEEKTELDSLWEHMTHVDVVSI